MNKPVTDLTGSTGGESVAALVTALAAGDVSGIAGAFAAAGMSAAQPAHGVLQLRRPAAAAKPVRLLLSVGIHGDETAPIEIVGRILQDIAETPHRLVPDLMLVIGNPAAIAAGRRYIDADLNRLFKDGRGELGNSAEASRADAIMRATGEFFAGDGGNWHLDLHTAIRPSRYPAFAVVPDAVSGAGRRALLGCLGAAGVEAAILNPSLPGTYSAWTAEQYGAVAATVELGQVGSIGGNDLDRFAAAFAMLEAFLTTGIAPSASPPPVFRVAQQLIKHSPAFRMAVDRTAHNFTEMQPGQLIAEDGDVVYRVGNEPEYVVFPNPDVRPGLRAGLMVVRSRIGEAGTE